MSSISFYIHTISQKYSKSIMLLLAGIMAASLFSPVTARAIVIPHDNCRQFLLLSLGRSGSSALGQLIHEHPQAMYLAELFKRRTEDFQTAPKKRKRIQINNAPLYLNDMRTQCDKFKAVGFKSIGTPEEILNVLIHDPDIVKIVLKRENIFERHLSLVIAERNNKWFMRKGEAYDPKPVYIDIKKLFYDMNRVEESYESWVRSLEQSNQDYIIVTYEDIFLDKNIHEINRIFAFLGVEQVSPSYFDTLKSEKIVKKEAKEYITNFREVKDALKGTRWEQHLPTD